MKSFVLALTGPAGSGKSTVAKTLAKQIERSVNIEVDHVKHMIVNGFAYETLDARGIKQWELLGTNLGALAHNFAKENYHVIINGYLNEQGFKKLLQQVQLTHQILLLPLIEVTTSRDTERPPDKRLDATTIARHHNYFSNTVFYDNFMRIDSSHHTIDETVLAILSILEQN